MRGYLCELTCSFVQERPASVKGGILADDMGLGKTLCALSLVASCKEKGPTLLVCPASLISNWKDQAQEHCPSLKGKLGFVLFVFL